ncbi:MAG: pyridoxamine 5'-phosphate oxidase family protein [Chloroflexales bacterium]|nr:pyridoxamine 5'-phosphate oxidase family protein [Chloroflexales bacterium]
MPLPPDELEALHELLRGQRQAALATLRGGAPAVSLVAYAPDGAGGFLLHLSALSQHTADIHADAHVALLVCQPDDGQGNPLTLHRVSVDGAAQPIARDDVAYAAAKARYLERLPGAAITFTLSDFTLFRVVATGGRFIAGFGRAYDVGPMDL